MTQNYFFFAHCKKSKNTKHAPVAFCMSSCPSAFRNLKTIERVVGNVILDLDIWLAVHHSITFLLLPTWYTNFFYIHINYVKLNSSTCFERNPLIIRRSTTQIVHMPPLVSSLSASDRLVQPLRKDSFLGGCTRNSPAKSDDTRGCICTICVVDRLMMGGMRSKRVEGFKLM